MNAPDKQPVSVVDFDIPFWSMVRFLIKFAFAAIPAAVILTAISSIVFGILSAIFSHHETPLT